MGFFYLEFCDCCCIVFKYWLYEIVIMVFDIVGFFGKFKGCDVVWISFDFFMIFFIGCEVWKSEGSCC